MLPLVVGKRGRYRLGAQPVAEGGFAAVHIGIDRRTGGKVAAKIMVAGTDITGKQASASALSPCFSSRMNF